MTILTQVGEYLNAPTRELDTWRLVIIGAQIGTVIAVVGLVLQTLSGRDRDRWR